MCPMIQTSDVLGGLWIPGDGVGDPYEICVSLVSQVKKKGAAQNNWMVPLIRFYKFPGVTVIENCSVQKVLEHKGRVSAVQTDKGTVQCDVFVNCGGLWARKVGKLSQTPIKVPLHPSEHYCLHTKPITGLDPNTPGMKNYFSFFNVSN